MVDVAGGGHHQVAGRVAGVVVGHAVVVVEGAHHGAGAEDGPAQRVIGPGGGGGQVEDVVLGGVLAAGDLFDDHLPLGVDAPLLKGGVDQHVAEKLEGPLQVLVDEAGVEAGALL